MRSERSQGASADSARRPLRVVNIITRMILGGAQETAVQTCELIDRGRFPSEILSGLETGPEGELHGECRKHDIPLHFESHLLRRVSPANDIKALIGMVRFLRRGRYDIVHTHSSKAGILGRMAGRLAGVPIVIHTAHGWGQNRGETKMMSRVYIMLEQFCAWLSHALIAVAQSVVDEGLANGFGNPGKYTLIRSGIDVDQFSQPTSRRAELRAGLGLTDDMYVVGYVGRFDPLKAPVEMVEAFGHVAAAVPEAHLVMVGDGPLRPDVEALIEKLGVGDRVHLLGLRRDVPEILPTFDAFALSSVREGLPRVFPQAMAAGLPIVATRIDGAADAIVEGESGLLVEPGDMKGLGEKLIELARDPERRRRMGAAGFERVEEFSSRRMVHLIEDLYEKLAVEKGLLPPASQAGEAR